MNGWPPLFDHPQLAGLPAFALSLALGLLIGLERERKPTRSAGVRTFTLTCLLGTLSGLLATALGIPWLVGVVWGLVSLFIVFSIHKKNECGGSEPETTTQVALLMCFGMGVLVWLKYATLAVILTVVMAVLLYAKQELDHFSRNLSREDLSSFLLFAVLSLVILPILPNQDFGPYAALNPRQVWFMVVLISGVSLAGYVALRLIGQRYGAPLLGLLGGLVSSTATTLLYARQARDNPELLPMSSVIILLANMILFVRIIALVWMMAPSLGQGIASVLGGGFVVGMTFTVWVWKKMASRDNGVVPTMTNPTELKTALTFGAIYAVVLLSSAWLVDEAGSRGFYLVAFASGITDLDAITLSSVRLFELHRLTGQQVIVGVALAIIANTLFKLSLMASIGRKPLIQRCLPVLGCSMLGLLPGLLWAL